LITDLLQNIQAQTCSAKVLLFFTLEITQGVHFRKQNFLRRYWPMKKRYYLSAPKRSIYIIFAAGLHADASSVEGQEHLRRSSSLHHNTYSWTAALSWQKSLCFSVNLRAVLA